MLHGTRSFRHVFMHKSICTCTLPLSLRAFLLPGHTTGLELFIFEIKVCVMWHKTLYLDGGLIYLDWIFVQHWKMKFLFPYFLDKVSSENTKRPLGNSHSLFLFPLTVSGCQNWKLNDDVITYWHPQRWLRVAQATNSYHRFIFSKGPIWIVMK